MNEILEEYKQLCKELNKFEKNKIPLCAAETYISDFSKQALISNFEGKYSFVDTNGNNDFIGGTYVFRLNELLKKECQLLFNAKYTNADTKVEFTLALEFTFSSHPFYFTKQK